MKRFLSFFISSRFVLSLTFLVNISAFVFLVYFASLYVYPIVSAIAFVVALMVLIHSSDESQYKLTWLFVIVLLPLYGTVLYLYTKSSRKCLSKKSLRAKLLESYLPYLNSVEPNNLSSTQLRQSLYIQNTSHFPIFGNSSSKYFASGEEFFIDLCKKLRQAKKFIMLEYFIIKPGCLWTEIESILVDKASQGIEVKILYDDFGCMDKFSHRYKKSLRSKGIDIVPFNKIYPTITKNINYRDHRKLAIIDGKYGYTGGLNIGDEYTNEDKRFGHWKDAGIRLQGEILKSFIFLFATSWSIVNKSVLNTEDYISQVTSVPSSSSAQLFGSGPMDDEPIARDNYIRIINNAKNYLYITTPYLILDGAMLTALKLCAKSGVDVRIITPGIPDKKLIYNLTQSYYDELIEAGVKIYEYTPGFIHSKIMICDDDICCIGTINFDFRSLFLHFENAVMLYNDRTIADVKADYIRTINLCHRVTTDDIYNRKWYKKLTAKLLKFFAPLL